MERGHTEPIESPATFDKLAEISSLLFMEPAQRAVARHMTLSTHILDIAAGRPVAGVTVRLEAFDGDGWRPLGSSRTDVDGRITDLLGAQTLERGEYRITFEVGPYLGPDSFYPEVAVVFRIDEPDEHHHVPLLLGPYGYTTYRGS